MGWYQRRVHGECSSYCNMTKGTSSFGKRHNKTHTLCRRCGRSSYHIQKSRCAQCDYPNKRLRHYNWSVKAKRRKTTGTGRIKHLKIVQVKFRNGFREESIKSFITQSIHRYWQKLLEEGSNFQSNSYIKKNELKKKKWENNFFFFKKKKKKVKRNRRDYGAPSSAWRRIFFDEGSVESPSTTGSLSPLDVSWPLLLFVLLLLLLFSVLLTVFMSVLSLVVSLPFVTASRLVSSELITTDSESLVASEESSVTAAIGPDESSLSLPSRTVWESLVTLSLDLLESPFSCPGLSISSGMSSRRAGSSLRTI